MILPHEVGAGRPPELTPEAILATHLYAARYAAQDGNAMAFWATLELDQQRHCDQIVAQLARAWRRRQPRASRL